MLSSGLLANEENEAALIRLNAEGRLPHAVLLEGPRGSGRFTLARFISAAAVCRILPEGCGECPDCRLAMDGKHPDVETYARAGAPGTLTIGGLRAIRQSAATPPVQGRRRVVILRDIQDAAQQRTLNTLLKLIEEPPEYLMFIITADSRQNLLPTVVSRCLLLRMRLPEIGQCAGELRRRLGMPEGESAALSDYCRGNIGRALTLQEDAESARVLADAAEITGYILASERYALLRALQKYERNRSGARELTAHLQEIFSRLVRARYEPEGGLFYEAARRLSQQRGERILDTLARAALEGQSNVNLPLALTRMAAGLMRD